MTIDKLCECGCGLETSISKMTYKPRGLVKGEHVRFLQGHNWRGLKRGEQSAEHTRKVSEANRGRKLSTEQIQKISGENNHLYGKKRPKEVCEKISKGRKGMIFSDEHRRNLSKANKGKRISLETKRKLSELFKGRPITEEQKQKISKALKGKYTKEKSWMWKGGPSVSHRRSYLKSKDDAKYKLNSNISRSVWGVLRGEKKGRHWESLVGYTLADLKSHMEQNFQSGMTWENYGKWHVDHIIPISAHNFTKPEHEDFKKCWALENLQPMWATENISKGAKLKNGFQPALQLAI